jgi:hypothetical protein
MSTLRVNTIQNSGGTGSPAINGLAAAWVNFNGTGTVAIRASSNVFSITDKWKVDGSDGQGFIAHELQEVIPDCVTGEKDAVDADGNPVYQGIDTSFLTATLTSAIQELKAIVDAQAERISVLENNNVGN